MAMFSNFVAIIMSLVTAFTGFISGISHAIADIHDKLNTPAIVVDFEEKDEDAIRVMSFNIRFGKLGALSAKDRQPMVEATIRKGNPDSIGLQEATTEWMEFLTVALSDTYGYVGVGRDDGVSAGEHSAIFYLKDKYTLIDSGNFWLSETPEVPSKGWDADCNRICTWAVLEDKTTGEQYVHFNAHFDNVGSMARYNSVQLILSEAAKYSHLPVVFTADMNVPEYSQEYAIITAEGNLNDTKKLAEDTMDYLTYHDRKPALHEGVILDYIMVNDNFDALTYKVVTAGIDGNYVSDHFPIYADIVIK